VLSGVEAREAGAVAERLRDALRREPVNGLRVTMSFGVAALAPGEAFDEDVLFARADAALYRAKASGRDRVCLDRVAAGGADAAAAASDTTRG
jgi:diguanylate cyclase (GGDEF)-like protein